MFAPHSIRLLRGDVSLAANAVFVRQDCNQTQKTQTGKTRPSETNAPKGASTADLQRAFRVIRMLIGLRDTYLQDARVYCRSGMRTMKLQMKTLSKRFHIAGKGADVGG